MSVLSYVPLYNNPLKIKRKLPLTFQSSLYTLWVSNYEILIRKFQLHEKNTICLAITHISKPNILSITSYRPSKFKPDIYYMNSKLGVYWLQNKDELVQVNANYEQHE